MKQYNWNWKDNLISRSLTKLYIDILGVVWRTTEWPYIESDNYFNKSKSKI